MNLPLTEYYNLLAAYLAPQRRKVILLAVLILGGIALQLVSPQIVRRFIDTAQAGGDMAILMQSAILFLAVALVRQVVRLGAAYVTEDVKWRATNWLRNDLSDHCMKLDMKFHNDLTPGAMIERIDGDVDKLSNFLSQFVLRLLGNGLLLIGVLVILFWEDWRIGLTYSFFTAAMMVILVRVVKIGVPFWAAEREASSKMFGSIEEWLGGTEDIKANGGTAYVEDRLQRSFRDLFVAARKAMLAGSLAWGTTGMLFSINAAIGLALGAWLFQNEIITLGTIYLIISYSGQLMHPIQQLSHQMEDLQAATASITRIRELLDTQPQVQNPTRPDALPDGPLQVTFDNVTFGYTLADDPEDEPVLKHVDFELASGKVLGLLGRTGSGKTTMTRLLFRLHDPSLGAVRLGDVDLRAAELADIRSHVGMVTQDVQLFRASVRDNLTFFDKSVPDQRILDALEILELDEWFSALDYGLDTRLEASGRGLSAGQAQLLAFTRVFLKDPGLVIMDEASSRLDPVTEHLIERAVDRLLYKRTGIIVAHRLATVQRADEIMILQDGEIVEHGGRIVLSANSDSRFSQLLRTGMAEVLV